MRIGYPRAARLIDRLEQLGIIGPAEAGGRPRVVRDDGTDNPDHPTPTNTKAGKER